MKQSGPCFWRECEVVEAVNKLVRWFYVHTTRHTTRFQEQTAKNIEMNSHFLRGCWQDLVIEKKKAVEIAGEDGGMEIKICSLVLFSTRNVWNNTRFFSVTPPPAPTVRGTLKCGTAVFTELDIRELQSPTIDKYITLMEAGCTLLQLPSALRL